MKAREDIQHTALRVAACLEYERARALRLSVLIRLGDFGTELEVVSHPCIYRLLRAGSTLREKSDQFVGVSQPIWRRVDAMQGQHCIPDLAVSVNSKT